MPTATSAISGFLSGFAPGLALFLVAASISCAHRPPAARSNTIATTEYRVDASRDGYTDAAVASSPPPRDAVDDPSDGPSDARAATVRDVDWCNHGYGDLIPPLDHCEGSVGVAHRRGEGDHSTRHVRFVSATYGDLNGDGRDDALVVLDSVDRPLIIQPAPSPVEHLLAVFDLRGVDLYLYPITIAGDGDIVGVRIERREALLTRRVSMRECTERWRLVGEEFQRVGHSGC